MKSHPIVTGVVAVFLVALVLLPPTAVAAQEGLRIYISADMEGIAGVVTADQLGPSGFEYGRFRAFMTAEVNAAIEAAREMGATEIVVSDSHGNGENLLLEDLPQDIQVIRSWPRPLGMMEGIDESFDAAILIGYHASTGNVAGVRAHTMSSANLTSLKINGVEMSEGGVSGAIAGYFGVPVVMISGDDAAVAEVSATLGPIEGAVVKWSYSFHSARTLMPAAARELIGDKVRAALGRIDEFEPFRIEGDIELDLSFKNYTAAELLAYLPIVDRVDSHTVRFVGDIREVSMFIEFALGYSASITP